MEKVKYRFSMVVNGFYSYGVENCKVISIWPDDKDDVHNDDVLMEGECLGRG